MYHTRRKKNQEYVNVLIDFIFRNEILIQNQSVLKHISSIIMRLHKIVLPLELNHVDFKGSLHFHGTINNIVVTDLFNPFNPGIFLRSARTRRTIAKSLSRITSYDIRCLRRRQNAKYFFCVLHVLYEMTCGIERVNI